MKCEKIYINTPFIKLDALLKFAGVAETGGHAKEIVKQGVVLVNGEPCTLRGRKISPGTKVSMDDICLEVEQGED